MHLIVIWMMIIVVNGRVQVQMFQLAVGVMAVNGLIKGESIYVLRRQGY